jgi:hypothetical protein
MIQCLQPNCSLNLILSNPVIPLLTPVITWWSDYGQVWIGNEIYWTLIQLTTTVHYKSLSHKDT